MLPLFVNPLLLFGQVGQFDPHALRPETSTQFHIHSQLNAPVSVFPRALILTSPGMRRGWQTAPYTSHNVWKNLKEWIRCLQLRLTLSVSVSCCYIVTLIWSWDRETTQTAVGWHTTQWLSISQALIIQCWLHCIDAIQSVWTAADSGFLQKACICVYHLYLCREQWLKATGVHCMLSDLSMFCPSVHRIACFHAVTVKL